MVHDVAKNQESKNQLNKVWVFFLPQNKSLNLSEPWFICL